MIIVSQDRKEITNNMNIDITENYDENFTQRWKIENDYYNLGYYKTEERAKEVLQEIKNTYVRECKTYEMPKE